MCPHHRQQQPWVSGGACVAKRPSAGVYQPVPEGGSDPVASLSDAVHGACWAGKREGAKGSVLCVCQDGRKSGKWKWAGSPNFVPLLCRLALGPRVTRQSPRLLASLVQVPTSRPCQSSPCTPWTLSKVLVIL